MKVKIIRTSTVPLSLNALLRGQLNFLNQFFKIIAVSGPGPDLDTVKEREQINVKEIAMQREIAPIRDLISLIRLYLYFKKEQPKIVHSITPKAGLLSMLAAKWANVPIRLHTYTGLIFPTRTGMMQKLLIQMDRLLCRCATNIYPEGLGVKKDLEEYNITNKKLEVLANGNVNGIDLNYFNPDLFPEEGQIKLRNNLGIEHDEFVFIFVGRLVGDKGINELVSTFSKISAKHRVRLLLVGALEPDADPLKEKTFQLLKKNKSIIAVGFQNDVRPYFAISDALVFPSYREGFPNVVMEAGAMGLPSIATDISGCNEIIIDGENGVIVPPKKEQPLLMAMMKFAENRSWTQEMALKARELIATRYEQKIVWEALLVEYRNLLEKQ